MDLPKKKVYWIMGFSSSLAPKYVALNNEPCIVRPTLINLDPIKYYSFMISLDKCSGNCNDGGDSLIY